jgi:hypothetical protein
VNERTQRLCVWAGPLFCLLFAIGMVPLAQFIPPPKASDSAQEIVKLYSEQTDRLRAGLVLMMIGAAFVAPWAAAITTQMKRIEGRHSPLAWTSLACGAVNVFVVLLPVMIMIAAAFRPGRDPEVTQALNDLAWILFVMNFAPVFVQQLAIGIAAFTDGEGRVFPRWVGYFNVWCAALLLPAVLIPFFKTGAFAWHGIFEFWLAAVVFFGWVVVMTVVTLRAIGTQAREEAAA